MDVFVIHSGSDKGAVSEKIKELKHLSHDFNPLILNDGGFFWKVDAAKKIKKSQMVVFFIGENSHKSPYIAWEIHTAIKFEKPIYTIKLDEKYKSHEALEIADPFSNETKPYDKPIDFDKLIGLIEKHSSGDYKVFNQCVENIDKSILLEQYKIFLQTSEDLVSRRQNVNSFYISINSALVAVFGALLALDMSPFYKCLISFILAVVGIILSVSWVKILISYGDLNSSKMKIISHIEKQLPASLYDAEWAALSDRLNKRKYVSFTNSEKRVPHLFIIVYFCIFISTIALMLY